MPLQKFKNKYSGERVFILGNGPSLEKTPLHSLVDEYTFGVNNIANIFDKTKWRPSFYLAIHAPPNIPEENVFEVVDLDIPCFFPSSELSYVPEEEHVERFDLVHLSEKEDVDISPFRIDYESIEDHRDVWSNDVSEVVYHYTTVLYPAMQIADYMGFTEMYLLGCDLYDEWDLHMIFDDGDDPALYQSDHESKPRRIYDFISSSDYPLRSFINGLAYRILNSATFRKSQPLLMKLDDRFANQVHFYDTFEVSQFLAGNEIRNEKMIRSHELARKISSELDFNIYNATLGGSLEVHPRVDLYEILEE